MPKTTVKPKTNHKRKATAVKDTVAAPAPLVVEENSTADDFLLVQEADELQNLVVIDRPSVKPVITPEPIIAPNPILPTPVKEKPAETKPIPVRLEDTIVKQPDRIKGKIPGWQIVLLWQHPDNGGGYPILTRLKPGDKQRPYYFQDKLEMMGLMHLIDNKRHPIYLMQEVKIGDEYYPAPYEPSPLSPDDISPGICHNKTDWSRWRAYIMHRVAGLGELIKTGIIAIVIIAIVIIFFMSWSKTRTPVYVAPPAATTIPTAGANK